MIPAGYVGLVFCDTRRAEAWRAALEADGIAAAVAETDGDDIEKGACVVAVPRARLVAANALVTAVTQGRRQLPATRSNRGAVAIAVVVVAAMLAALLRGL